MTTWRYALHSTVPADKTRIEIMAIIRSFGGAMQTVGWMDEQTEAVGFKLNGVPILLKVHHPPATRMTLDTVLTALRERNVGGAVKRPKTIDEAVTFEVNRRWRCLLIQVKAVATMILDAGVDPVNAFIGQVALPGNVTVAERIAPELGEMLESGRMPTLAIGAGS